jgi:spermidine synthase
VILWLLATGLVSVLGQVALLRELSVAFYGSELIVILAIGAWLLWTALGTTLGRRAGQRPPAHVRALLLAVSLVLPGSLVFVRAVRQVFGAVPGAYLPFPQQLLALFVSLLPIGLLLGLLFRWVARLYVGEGRTLAGAYAIESVGGLLGGALATLSLAGGVQNLRLALGCGLVALAAAGIPWRGRPRWLLLLGAPSLAFLGLALVGSPLLDHRMTAWNHPQLLATRDTPYGRVTVTKTSGQVSLFENDALSFESEGTSAEELAHLAALQRERPRTMLLLGGGVEGLVEELLKHRPDRLEYVELNEALLEMVTEARPELGGLLRDEPVAVRIADPRRDLDHESRFDLVVVAMPEPASAQANRFYTREFFAQCAARLGEAGVLAFRLKMGENVWTPSQARRAGSIHRAVAEVFADVVVLPGTSAIVLASNAELPRDPDLLCHRFRSRGISTRLVSAPYIRYLYTNDRYQEHAARLSASTAPANSDERPISYQYTLLLWLSRFFPAMTWLDVSAWGGPLAPIGLGLLLAGFLAVCLLPAARRASLVAVAGLLGMVLEAVLILGYQTARGVLYQDLGLLLAAFMAGLAAGAAGLSAWDRTGTRPSGLPRSVGFVLLLGFALLCVALASLVEAGALASLPLTAALLFAAGLLVAAVFAYGSLRGRPDQRDVVAPLYAADLLGGCLGSLVASLLLVPVLGLAGSAQFAALVATLALLLL